MSDFSLYVSGLFYVLSDPLIKELLSVFHSFFKFTFLTFDYKIWSIFHTHFGIFVNQALCVNIKIFCLNNWYCRQTSAEVHFPCLRGRSRFIAHPRSCSQYPWGCCTRGSFPCGAGTLSSGSAAPPQWICRSFLPAQTKHKWNCWRSIKHMAGDILGSK